MMHGLSLGSGDAIVLDLFGQVTGQVSSERLGSSGFFLDVSTSCLAPFFLYVVQQDLM